MRIEEFKRFQRVKRFQCLRADEIAYKTLLPIIVLLELPELPELLGLLYKPHVISHPLYAKTVSVILSAAKNLLWTNAQLFARDSSLRCAPFKNDGQQNDNTAKKNCGIEIPQFPTN